MNSYAQPGEEGPATADETRQPLTLPPELWLDIFELATYVPGALETESLDPFRLAAPLPIYEAKIALFASMQIKTKIVRVCRQWRDLGTLVLYRIVIAQENITLMRLQQTLLGPQASQAYIEGTLSLRTCIQRFSCLVDPVHTSDSDIEQLSRILTNLPNLSYFTLRVSKGVQPNQVTPVALFSALQECRRSLRALHLDLNMFAVTNPEWCRMISSMIGLRVLSLRLDDLPQDFTLLPSGCMLPNLRSLTLRGVFTPAPLAIHNQLPALRELSVGLASWHNVFAQLGQTVAGQITCLTVRAGWRDEINPLLSHALEAFPNATRLALWVDNWHEFPSDLCIPNIEYLGIGRTTRRECRNTVYNQFIDNLSSIVAPKMRVLRFVGPDEWLDFHTRRPKIWSRFQTLVRRSKCRVEDSAGQAF
ncbi:hypothetical protein OE88DRAFT_1724488 [Heliocybe sulcata]|uniref:F-box domain-containing protein n=1 Tax=Heliocybe sulcata TaxID=5364 RepID=A0A5C3NCR8_9AGAM|nr:hypothetical protein OE88DRAFT_1724488 [Heliocybe sulcata]